jgi:hypothetical protein
MVQRARTMSATNRPSVDVAISPYMALIAAIIHRAWRDAEGHCDAPGHSTPVWLWECIGTDAQKWTYDPETGVLQNALGNVLDVQSGVLQPGTPVWTWTRNEGLAQQWFSYSPYVLTCTGCDRLLPPNRLLPPGELNPVLP